MIEFKYDPQFVPPAPTVELVLISTVSRLETPLLTGFMDTGADATMVPVTLLEQIQAPLGKERFARSAWGDRHSVLVFIVEVRIGEWSFEGVQVIGYEGDQVIVGRDVLNKLWLLLAGPERTTEVSGNAP